MLFANVSFKRPNLLSEQSKRNHFKNWFVPFSVHLSSAASMPAGRGTAVTHTENCEDVIHVRAVIRSWFVNLLHTENCRWGHDSRSHTVLKVALCHSFYCTVNVTHICKRGSCPQQVVCEWPVEDMNHSPTHSGQTSWFTSSNRTAKIRTVLLTSV